MTYPTAAAARTELLRLGYTPGFPPPGKPLPWVRVGDGIPDRKAIYGSDSAGWRVVAYPKLEWLD